MKIVEKISDGEIVMVADSPTTPTPAEDFTVHDIPGWDWSLADLTGVDRTQWDWMNQLMWNGSTLVKKV